MKRGLKIAIVLLAVLVSASVLYAGGQKEAKAAPAQQAPGEIPQGLKIGYFVSDMNNGFHQAHANWAKKYGAEKYGAVVQLFDGKSDANVMAQNFDQAVAQGMNMVSLHIWQGESIRPAAREALADKMVITSYFDKIPELAVPHIMPGEASVSEEMGRIAATQWKKAHPDQPIVFVAVGWPEHEGVTVGRTNPFEKGVKSVDPSAKWLGCMDASKGSDQAFKVIQDLVQANPGLNIIYSEASNLTLGTMPALQQLGRGKAKDGVPLTEIVCSVDTDEAEIKQIFDPTSSLKMSMGLPPKDTAIKRIDVMMQIYKGELKQLDPSAGTIYVPNKLFGWWSQKSVKEAVDWYNDQFGATMQVPTYN